MVPLKGIFVPNLIPFSANGEINERELRRLVSWLIDRGIQGLYPNGSTGEFIRLSFEERIRVVEIIADENAGRVPILAGAAEGNIAMTLKACERYAELGCAAVSLTGPYYYKVDAAGIEHYFREVAACTPIDILAYNIPLFANEIPVPVLSRLAQECPRIIGTKDSSRDMPRLMHTINAIKPHRPDFVILTGAEEILLPSLLMGADGGTIATAGVVPEAVMALYAATMKGDLDEARRLQFKLLEFMKTMLTTGNFPDGFRLGASARGFDFGPERQPVPPTNRAQLESVRSQLACTLAESGYSEAAELCRNGQESTPAHVSGNGSPDRRVVDAIVRDVLRSIKA